MLTLQVVFDFILDMYYHFLLAKLASSSVRVSTIRKKLEAVGLNCAHKAFIKGSLILPPVARSIINQP